MFIQKVAFWSWSSMGKVDFQIDATEFLKSLDQYDNHVTNGLKDAIKDCALAIESDAKRNCPVDTGRLRMSITSDTSNINDFEASVGTNVEYATHVEYGTHKQSPKPYLRPAYNKNVAKLQTKINKVLGGK